MIGLGELPWLAGGSGPRELRVSDSPSETAASCRLPRSGFRGGSRLAVLVRWLGGDRQGEGQDRRCARVTEELGREGHRPAGVHQVVHEQYRSIHSGYSGG
jgi:hypothetical protein